VAEAGIDAKIQNDRAALSVNTDVEPLITRGTMAQTFDRSNGGIASFVGRNSQVKVDEARDADRRSVASRLR
jgi:hypothetical protein